MENDLCRNPIAMLRCHGLPPSTLGARRPPPDSAQDVSRRLRCSCFRVRRSSPVCPLSAILVPFFRSSVRSLIAPFALGLTALRLTVLRFKTPRPGRLLPVGPLTLRLVVPRLLLLAPRRAIFPPRAFLGRGPSLPLHLLPVPLDLGARLVFGLPLAPQFPPLRHWPRSIVPDTPGLPPLPAPAVVPAPPVPLETPVWNPFVLPPVSVPVTVPVVA